ncbi:hypothetical protein GQ457_08G016410 [Hibiscus cannabinus]
MKKMGFSEWWVKRVMQSITTLSFYLIINGESRGEFQPTRGLRQGDPLSPFMFLFIYNIFSWLIDKEMKCSKFEGLKIKRSCPTLSHLLFANDCILFSKANAENCRDVCQLLDDFQNATGQTVNYEKSSVFFAPNCFDGKKAHMLNILGFGLMEEDSSYLGLPSIWGRNKKIALVFIKDRVMRKLQGWKTKLLNQAGKEVLIEAEVQAIPSYVMHCFLLLATFCDELCALIARF